MTAPLYVPIIKGKKNDIIAVGKLARSVRERIKPLIEAMPINPKNPDVDKHVYKFCQYIRKHTPLGELFGKRPTRPH